jgi:hypothetical protein
MLPSEWFKMANPLAEATNRGEKITPKIIQDFNHRAVRILVPFFLSFTALTVYVLIF